MGDKSGSHTPPFILTFEIFNRNIHNYLVDSGASSNVMPYSIFKNLNLDPMESTIQIVQVDRLNVKFLGELKGVLIRLTSKFHCYFSNF
jgi:hypothetical protein